MTQAVMTNSRNGWYVGWTEGGVLAERVSGKCTSEAGALKALDLILGGLRRTRTTERRGWYFVLGPDRTPRHIVGYGGNRSDEFPRLTREAWISGLSPRQVRAYDAPEGAS